MEQSIIGLAHKSTGWPRELTAGNVRGAGRESKQQVGARPDLYQLRPSDHRTIKSVCPKLPRCESRPLSGRSPADLVVLPWPGIRTTTATRGAREADRSRDHSGRCIRAAELDEDFHNSRTISPMNLPPPPPLAPPNANRATGCGPTCPRPFSAGRRLPRSRRRPSDHFTSRQVVATNARPDPQTAHSQFADESPVGGRPADNSVVRVRRKRHDATSTTTTTSRLVSGPATSSWRGDRSRRRRNRN